MNFQAVVDKVKNYFDWTPVAVSEPVEIYCDYRDKGHVLLGYEVTVTYKHHGTQKHLFVDDEERFCLVSRAQARKNALDFYHEKQRQIKQR